MHVPCGGPGCDGRAYITRKSGECSKQDQLIEGEAEQPSVRPLARPETHRVLIRRPNRGNVQVRLETPEVERSGQMVARRDSFPDLKRRLRARRGGTRSWMSGSRTDGYRRQRSRNSGPGWRTSRTRCAGGRRAANERRPIENDRGPIENDRGSIDRVDCLPFYPHLLCCGFAVTQDILKRVAAGCHPRPVVPRRPPRNQACP